MKEIRLKGNFQGGHLIYGYKLENKKILIDEEKAEIVRYIYNQYSLGKYVKDIIKDLNEKHIYHKGKPFGSTTIYNILKNEKYTGIYFQRLSRKNYFKKLETKQELIKKVKEA